MSKSRLPLQRPGRSAFEGQDCVSHSHQTKGKSPVGTITIGVDRANRCSRSLRSTRLSTSASARISTYHTLRHSFATHTQLCTHVLGRGAGGVLSPLDQSSQDAFAADAMCRMGRGHASSGRCGATSGKTPVDAALMIADSCFMIPRTTRFTREHLP